MKEYLLRKQPSLDEISDLIDELESKSLATVFWHKSLKTRADIDRFLSIDDLLPTAELFDVVSCYQKIKEHKDKNSKVVIYGDYDADGAVAAAIMWRFLANELHMNTTVYIPDRHEEGYGLNKQALEVLATQGVNLIITVDCGVRDAVLIEEISNKTSMEFIVTDHHQPGNTFPKCTVVHPLFPGHESANKYISGGVVAWKIVRYLEDQFELTHQFSESVVDLAGTSLVTDIMPLTGENRVILRRAIQKMRSSASLGIKVLAEIAQVPISQISTYHLGYVIGPRLNASGRIGNQYTSTRLLSTNNESSARKYAQETHEINVKRQELTKRMVDQAEGLKKIINEQILLAVGENWDDGIIGLVAGKLMNTYNLPTIAVSLDREKGIAKGSARSFGNFDITGLFGKIADVFERFGGHQNAAGFTLKGIDTDNFFVVLENILKSDYSEYKPVALSLVDSYLVPNELTEQFFGHLSDLEPFGQANAAPLFAIKGKVAQFSAFGQQGTHVRIELQTEEGTIKCIAFDALRLVKDLQQGSEVILIGKPKIDEYQGRKQITFFVDDVLKALPESSE